MSTEHENGGDDWIDRDLVHRYREASAGLGERPSASTRAAILAEAAREVQAKPAVAGTAYRRRPSWPLAAAAVVMLSTLAVMLALRTQEEMPQFSAPEQTSGAAEKVAPPQAATPVAKPSRVNEEDASRKTPARDEAAPAKPAAAPPVVTSAAEPSRIDQEAARANSSARVQEPANAENRQSATRDAALNSAKRRESDQTATAPSERKQAPAPPAPVSTPAPASPPPAAPTLPKAFADTPSATEAPVAGSALKKAQRDASAGLQSRPLDQAAGATSTPDARADAVGRVSPVPSVAQERQRSESVETESAAAWLERIIRLRREGRHSEADAELKRFRERYPQVQPPADALPVVPAQ